MATKTFKNRAEYLEYRKRRQVELGRRLAEAYAAGTLRAMLDRLRGRQERR